MTTERQERKERLNALDKYADNLLSRDREQAALERELAAVRKHQSTETQQEPKKGDNNGK